MQGYEMQNKYLKVNARLRKAEKILLTVLWPTKLDIELGYIVFD
jgi:hypothetical protein